MTLPRKDALGREEETLPQQQFPAKGIRREKQVEGDISAHAVQHKTPGSDPLSAASIGAAEDDHTHLPQHNLSATTDPGVTDDEDSGYSAGSVWINISTPAIFQCVTAGTGVADWNQIDAIAAAADHDHTGGGDGGVLTKPELDDYMILGEISAPGGDPAANKGWLYVKDDGGTSGLYFEADDGTVTDLLAGGGGSGTLTTIKENDSQVGGADIEILDFLGADFDLTESPDKEIQIVIAAAIARVSALHAEDHKARHAGGADLLYSVHQYVFTPDAAPDADVETGTVQGLVHVSGPSTELVKRITVICETAAGTTFTFTLDYDSGNDDFDSFTVDTEIDEVAVGTAKGVVVTGGFTTSTITARSLIALDITAITGAPKDVTIILEVWRPLQT